MRGLSLYNDTIGVVNLRPWRISAMEFFANIVKYLKICKLFSAQVLSRMCDTAQIIKFIRDLAKFAADLVIFTEEIRKLHFLCRVKNP